MATKDLTPVDVLVVKSALEYMRKSLVRGRDNAKSDNLREALGKDIAALDKVIGQV